MAEEEQGFTFVDKRRNVPEAAEIVPETVTSVMGEEPVSDLSESDDQLEAALDESSPAPTTYDLIGYCINLLASQAWQKLGLLADPQTGEAQPDLAEAKVAIDAVGDLAGRLDAAPDTLVPADLRRDLRTLVNDLRLNYVSQRGPSA
ncbi:MAG: DUF1844 domain-containing protein [Janthinobacterium lividum]